MTMKKSLIRLRVLISMHENSKSFVCHASNDTGLLLRTVEEDLGGQVDLGVSAVAQNGDPITERRGGPERPARACIISHE